MNAQTYTPTDAARYVGSLTFTVERDRNGKLQAKNVFPLGFDRRELHVTTDKGYRGGIECEAVVYQVTEDGHGRQHCFDIGNRGGGDFRRTVKCDPKGRATAAAITRMHSDGLQGLALLIRDACTHYGQAEAGEALAQATAPAGQVGYAAPVTA